MSYFNAALGDRPPPPDPAPSDSAPPAPPPATTPTCPLCQGELLEDARLWHCVGRCGTRWLRADTGQLVDLAALPFGICGCCPAAQALVRSDVGSAVCPATGSVHLLLADGTAVVAEQLAAGRCLCCVPAQPLLRISTGVICPAHPAAPYEWNGGAWQVVAPSKNSTTVLAAIDAALQANAAKLTMYGLFDLD
ncbi:MAG: hypothetical protein H0T53_06335 [Herpetosiphonaceae bacterium]|nr:hypothetical protein [Herpetosiphonaceae bacterium]